MFVEKKNSKVKKVVLVFNAFRLGGSQTFAVELACRLKNAGYEVLVIAKKGAMKNEFEKNGIETKIVNWFEDVNPKTHILHKIAGSLISLLLLLNLKIRWKFERPSLIIASHPWPIYYMTRITPRDIPILPLIHGTTIVEFPPVKFQKIFDRLLNPVCVSVETSVFLKKNYNLEPKVVGNLFSGANYWQMSEIFLKNRSSNENEIVVASTLTENKIDTIWCLLDVISKEHIWNLKIVGEGAKFDEIQNRIDELNINNRAIILKPGSDLRPYYETAKLVVGVGRVVLEASSRGIPTIIASNGKLFGLLKTTNFEIAQENNFTGRAHTSIPLSTSSLHKALEEGIASTHEELIKVAKLSYSVGTIDPILVLIS